MPQSSHKRKGRHRSRSRKKRSRREQSRSERDPDSDTDSKSDDEPGFKYGPEVRAAQAQTEVDGQLRGDHYLLTARLPKVVKLRTDDELKEIYKFEKKFLGKGDFATVRKCTEKETGKEYAIKEIDKSYVFKRDAENVVKRTIFLEAACWAYLIPEHPNVVKVHKIYESPRMIHIVMEVLGKWTLTNSMSGIKPNEACAVFRKIVEAVAHLHDQGVVHCDLKGDNICLRDGDKLEPVLIDLGNSKPMTLPKEDQEGLDIFKLLSSHELRHTVSRDVDMQALGSILEWMLTGQRVSPHTRAMWAIKGQPTPFKEGVTPYAKDLLSFIQTSKERTVSTVSDILEHPWFREGLESAH